MLEVDHVFLSLQYLYIFYVMAIFKGTASDKWKNTSTQSHTRKIRAYITTGLSYDVALTNWEQAVKWIDILIQDHSGVHTQFVKTFWYVALIRAVSCLDLSLWNPPICIRLLNK